METNNRTVAISVVLALIGAVLGWIVPGILLADFGPPLALRIIFVVLPLALIPFMIGWLTPSLWWLAGAGAIGMLFLAIIAILTAPPQSLGEMLLRFPFVLPLLFTLAFAYLGRTFRKRMLRRRT